MAHAVPVPDKEKVVNKIERITLVLCPGVLTMELLPSQACFHDVQYLVNNVSIRLGLYRSINPL